VAVEVSDDISKWVYYDVSKQNFSGEKDFTKANKALAGAKKFAITPLAAAQFMLAKMRASPAKPKLAGVLPTGNPTLTMGCEEFGTKNFILGDFFVADNSPCRFDETMTLKEDYDYTCSHISKHGSVLRCNRMVLTVRHYANEGGAVDNRDAAGKRERANIEILQRKWPGVFKMNVKRNSCEVLMNWNKYGKENKSVDTGSSRSVKGKVGTKVMKVALKRQVALPKGLKEKSILQRTKKDIDKDYIRKRCSKNHGRSVGAVLSSTYLDANGVLRKYGLSDLRYDISRGYLVAKRG
jgi:hypothetical protein